MEEHNYMGKTVNRLVRNSFFLISSRAIDFGVLIFTTPVIARYLGLKAFGDYALVMAISIFVMPLVEFGSESIICRDVSRNRDNPSEYINSAIILRGLLSAYVLVFVYVVIELVFSNRELKLAIFVSTTSELIVSFCTLFFAVIRAYERMEYEMVCSFIHKMAFLTAIILVIKNDLGFVALFYAKLFSSIVFLSLALFFVFKQIVAFKRGFSWRIIRYILREAFPLAIITVLVTAFSKIDVFFLKYFKGSSDIALFEASNRLIIQLQFIPLSITISLFPFFSRISEDLMVSLKGYYKKGFKFLYIFSIFPAMFMIIGSQGIIALLYGKSFQQAAVSLKLLASTFVLIALSHLMHNILIVIGKQRLIIVSVGLCFISNALLDYILIPIYGYIGASIATLVAQFILFSATMFFMSVYVGRIDASIILVKPSVSVLLTGVACFFIITNGLASLIAGFFLGLSLYISILLMLGTFDENELGVIKEIIFRRKK